MEKKLLIIGGDKRQEYLRKILICNFNTVFHIEDSADLCELGNIGNYSHIILPIPFSKDKKYVYSNKNLNIEIDDLTEKLMPCHQVFGTGFGNETLDKLKSRGVSIVDFMQDKNFKLSNAYLTAQGALKLLLDNTGDYIVGKKALILGFGDVAKTLAEKLSRLGLDVFIAARNSGQLSTAYLSGYKTLKLSSVSSCIYLFDYIFGTIPFNVLASDDVKSIGDSSIYFELASAPFSAVKEHFTTHGKKYISGSALPGRFLPEASAKLMADFILNNL